MGALDERVQEKVETSVKRIVLDKSKKRLIETYVETMARTCSRRARRRSARAGRRPHTARSIPGIDMTSLGMYNPRHAILLEFLYATKAKEVREARSSFMIAGLERRKKNAEDRRVSTVRSKFNQTESSTDTLFAARHKRRPPALSSTLVHPAAAPRPRFGQISADKDRTGRLRAAAGRETLRSNWTDGCSLWGSVACLRLKPAYGGVQQAR